MGQRRGLGIAFSRAQYVIAIEAEQNRLVVGDARELEARGLVMGQVNWVAFPGPGGGRRSRGGEDSAMPRRRNPAWHVSCGYGNRVIPPTRQAILCRLRRESTCASNSPDPSVRLLRARRRYATMETRVAFGGIIEQTIW